MSVFFFLQKEPVVGIPDTLPRVNLSFTEKISFICGAQKMCVGCLSAYHFWVQVSSLCPCPKCNP